MWKGKPQEWNCLQVICCDPEEHLFEGEFDGPGRRWSELVPRLVALSGAAAKSCRSQTWGWPGAWQSDWKLRFLFSYASEGCTCVLQSKHSFDLVNTRVNVKYTSFVSTKWTESSMFDHTFLIIVSKPNISMVRATRRYSDACLLYIKQAADIRHSVSAYVCVYCTLLGKWARLDNAV